MIWRNVSFNIVKGLIYLLVLLTILLTTPMGTRLTLSLLNNIDGINFDYKTGALIRDIELYSFHLKLAQLDVSVKDLSAKIDFSCSWQKRLCLDTLKVADFSLTYTNNNENKTPNKANIIHDNRFFVMPFAIKAQAVELTKSHLVINQTVIDIEQFTAQVAIKASQFNIIKPSASQVTISLENNQKKETDIGINANNIAKKIGKSVHEVVSTLPEINLPIALNIQQLFIDELRIIDQEQKTNRTLDNKGVYRQSQFTGSWAKSDVKITNFQTSTVDYSIKNLVANTQLLPPYKINVTLAAQLHKLSIWPEASNSILDISLQGAFDDLAIDIVSRGSVTLHGQGQVNLTHSQLPFELQLSAEKLPLPLSLASFGQPSSLSLVASGDLVQQKINLNSQLNSYGYNNARLSLAAKHQQGTITLSELIFNDKDSNSHLSLHGNINFQSTEKSWQIFAESSGFTLPQIALKALVFPENTNPNTNPKTDGNIDSQSVDQTSIIEMMLPDVIKGRVLGKITSTGLWSKSQWSLSVNDTEILGTINNSALIIQGDIALNQSGYFSSGNLEQGKLLIAFDKDQLTLKTNSDNNWHVNGQLVIAKINRWYPFARGSITSDFSIKGNKNSPIITLNSKLEDLHWQQFYSPLVEISASYQPFNNHNTQLTINNNHLAITGGNGTRNIEKLEFNFSGDLYQQQLQLDWQGELAGKLKLSGQWHQALNQWQATIEQAALTYQQETLHNKQTFALHLNLDNQQLEIDKHCWQGKGVDICLPFDTSVGEFGDITLAANIDLSLMDELILPEQIQLSSLVSGEIKAQWSLTQAISAKANFVLSSGNIKVNDEYSEQQVSQWQQGDFSFSVNEAQLMSQLQLYDVQEQTLIDINSKVDLIDDFPIDAQIELNQFNLQPFQKLINQVVSLKGHLTSVLTVNGTIKNPIINGSLALASGELLLSQNPNKFENISAEFDINNNQATMLGEFYLKDNMATLSGQLAWQNDLIMNIDLNAKRLPLVFPPLLLMNISPSLNFSLKDSVVTIEGNLDVLDGSYSIEKLPKGSITVSDDVIIVDEYGKESFKASSGFDIKTNISVNIAKKFQVSGQGLQSHLYGQLQISQEQNKPLQLFGNIQSEKGTYQAYGQRLTIEKGEMNFNGPIDNPYFNLRASRHIRADDIEVGLQVTGFADALNMQLFSTPTMESPEMLSYLARGRGLDSGGGSSTAAASMLIGFGVTNSVGLFDQLEKIPLVNNIAVDTEGEGDTTQAIISGYVGNRVYLKYGVGVYEPINEMTVRLYLLNRLWLEIVSGIEQSSDIYYSFDID